MHVPTLHTREGVNYDIDQSGLPRREGYAASSRQLRSAVDAVCVAPESIHYGFIPATFHLKCKANLNKRLALVLSKGYYSDAVGDTYKYLYRHDWRAAGILLILEQKLVHAQGITSHLPRMKWVQGLLQSRLQKHQQWLFAARPPSVCHLHRCHYCSAQ